MDEAMRVLIEKRCRRTITSILSSKERELDGYLPDEAGAQFRKVVLDSVNDFHNFVMDIIRAMDTEKVTVNALFLQRIDQIYELLSKEGVDDGEPG